MGKKHDVAIGRASTGRVEGFVEKGVKGEVFHGDKHDCPCGSVEGYSYLALMVVVMSFIISASSGSVFTIFSMRLTLLMTVE